MGQFSFFLQDTHERIINNRPMHVVMCDNKGHKYVEECYEGYGVFGGKDYYELLAEMNGYYITQAGGYDLYILHLNGGAGINSYYNIKDAKEALRQKGIDLAFKGDPRGMNPNVLHPSLTAEGVYWNGKAPEPDPDQGFPMEEYDEEFYEEEEL